MRCGFKDAQEVKETSLKYNLHSWSVQGKLNPAVVEKAEGIYYYTADGKKMADMSSQLVNLNVGYGNKDMGALMAMLVLAILPIIIFYLFCQKYIIRGVAAGAVKG